MKYLPIVLEASLTVFTILFGFGFVWYMHNAGL